MLVDPNQTQPIPTHEGERYSTVNKSDTAVSVNGSRVYPGELATFVAIRDGRRLIWRKEVPLD